MNSELNFVQSLLRPTMHTPVFLLLFFVLVLHLVRKICLWLIVFFFFFFFLLKRETQQMMHEQWCIFICYIVPARAGEKTSWSQMGREVGGKILLASMVLFQLASCLASPRRALVRSILLFLWRYLSFFFLCMWEQMWRLLSCFFLRDEDNTISLVAMETIWMV